MAFLGEGRGKLILFGEHAAVHGHPALGIQLVDRTLVTLDGPWGSSWDISSVPDADRGVIRALLHRLEEILPDLARKGRGAVKIESNVPRGIGMGSSAALSVALAGAGLSAAGCPADSARIWELAHALEHQFHGTPSGIDTGFSLHKGINAFFPQPPRLPRGGRFSCAPLLIVSAAVPRSRDTGTLVRAVSERVTAGEQPALDAIRKLGEIARHAMDACAASESPGPRVGKLAEQAMEMLRSLGLGSRDQDVLLDEGRAAGALGGKLSGAGGGGAFFLVVPDRDVGRDVAGKIESAARSKGISLSSPPRLFEAC